MQRNYIRIWRSRVHIYESSLLKIHNLLLSVLHKRIINNILFYLFINLNVIPKTLLFN